jgi:cytochrome c oxidase assembly factor CtaG
MRFRLTPPGRLIFFVSLIVAITAVATLYTHVPVVGRYVSAHRFWVMAAAYALLLAGVIFEGL